MIFQIGGHIEIGAESFGLGHKIRAGAAHHRHPENFPFRGADGAHHGNIEGFLHPFGKGIQRRFIFQSADDAEPHSFRFGNKGTEFFQSQLRPENGADPVGRFIQIGMAGDQPDVMLDEAADHAAFGLTAVDAADPLEEKGMMGHHQLYLFFYGLF